MKSTKCPGLAILCWTVFAASIPAVQTGSESPIPFEKRQLFVSPQEGCATGDLNKDGYIDIVCSPYIFWGPHFVPQAFRSNHASPDYVHANSDHLYDVDGDGLIDIIIGAWGTEGIIWYKNPGDAANQRGQPWEMHKPWSAHTLVQTRGSMEMFALHDYDGDGVPEIHSACWKTEMPLEVWRFNQDKEAPALNLFELGTEGGGHGFAFGDVNGDGLEDVLCEIGWYQRPVGDPFAEAWAFHPETNLRDFHPSCPFVVGDLNDDGRLDIVFGKAHAYGLYWWEQLTPAEDGTTQWKRHTIDESWSQGHVLTWADLDNDGDDELIAGKCIWAHDGADPGAREPAVVYYYTWDIDTLRFTRHTISGPGENIALGRQISIADLNQDGRLDIVAPSKSGLWLFINRGILNVGV